MSHKYLRVFKEWKTVYGFSRRFKFWKQKLIYGFPETETYDLDYTFCLWAYEHLKMYVEKAAPNVDLTYHKFTYKDKEYTEIELIEKLLQLIEEFGIKSDFCTYLDEEKKYEEIGEIWAILLPALWW